MNCKIESPLIEELVRRTYFFKISNMSLDQLAWCLLGRTIKTREATRSPSCTDNAATGYFTVKYPKAE